MLTFTESAEAFYYLIDTVVHLKCNGTEQAVHHIIATT